MRQLTSIHGSLDGEGRPLDLLEVGAHGGGRTRRCEDEERQEAAAYSSSILVRTRHHGQGRGTRTTATTVTATEVRPCEGEALLVSVLLA